MSSFIKRALVVEDIEDGHTHVEIEYMRFIEDFSEKGAYKKFTDYFLTRPVGDWKELTFKTSSMPYENFLSIMVKQTLEIKQRLVNIVLENILLNNPNFHTKIRVLHASKILDPSFVPPVINSESSWQVSLLDDLCKEYIPDMIERSDHSQRLIKMFNVLKQIEQSAQ